MRAIATGILLIILSVGCGTNNSRKTATKSDAEIDVCSAVLDQCFDQPWWKPVRNYIIIRERTAYIDDLEYDDSGNPTNKTPEECAQSIEMRFQDISADTIHDYMQKREEAARLLEVGTELKVSHILVSRKEIEMLLRSSGWRAVREQYGKVAGIIELSRVGFNKDQTEALVYVAFTEGPLAGSGDYCLLRRKRDKWIIVSSSLVWIS